MRKLFVSFSVLLAHLQDGTVNAEDLDRGLFYFGCTRKHAFAPWEPIAVGSQDVYDELAQCGGDPDARASLHRTLVAALEKAEAEGRAAWRSVDEKVGYAKLDALLKANGYPPIGPLVTKPKSLDKQDLAATIKDAALELEVVYRR